MNTTSRVVANSVSKCVNSNVAAISVARLTVTIYTFLVAIGYIEDQVGGRKLNVCRRISYKWSIQLTTDQFLYHGTYQVHPWCLSNLLWYQPGHQRNPPPNSRKSRIRNIRTHTDCSSVYTCCDHQITTASLMPSPYIPDTRLETWRRYEIGFLSVAGSFCMASFQWKLNLWKLQWIV